MKFSKTFRAVVILLFMLSVVVQAGNIDSLKRQIPYLSDTNLVNAYLEINHSFYDESEIDSVHYWATRGLELSRKLKDEKGTAESLFLLSELPYMSGHYHETEKYVSEALGIFKELHETRGIIYCMRRLGQVQYQRGNYKKSLDYFWEAIKIAEENNMLKAQSDLLMDIGIVYSAYRDFHKAMDYYRESLAVSQQVGDDKNYGAIYNNLGTAFEETDQYDSAMIYYRKAEHLHRKYNNTYNLAGVLNNIANLYINAKEFNKALDYYRQTLALDLAHSDSLGLTHSYYGFADIYNQTGSLDSALYYAEKSMAIVKKINAGKRIPSLYKLLIDIHKSRKSYPAVFAYYDSLLAYNDSVYSETKSRQIQELETRYETEKKEQENLFLKRETHANMLIIKRQRILVIVIIILLTVVSLSAFFAYRAYITRKKLAQKIEADKQIIEKQALELKSLDKLKSQFFANISHEFRTPLTLILGPLGHALKQNTDIKPDDLEIMHRNANRLLELINQLLDLSKLEAGNMKLVPESTEFVSYVKGLTMSFSSLAVLQKKHLDFHCDLEECILNIDRSKTDKIFFNLLSNAFKYTKAGDHIKVEVLRRDSDIEIKISDTGKGIPEKDLPHIFERFYQGTNSQEVQSPGTGIGLALVKQLVKLHGGTIEVQSKEDFRTSFTIHLPLVTSEKVTGNPKNPDSKFIVAPETYVITDIERNNNEVLKFDEQDEIVLIVEDNPDVRQYIRRSIHREFKIIEASNGIEGYERAKQYIPDLIISDVMMPEMNGIEFTRKVKSDMKTSHIPVILLTARAADENRIEGLETGADDYLIKPFGVEELIVRVRNLIIQRKKLRKLFGSNMLAEPDHLSLSPQDKKFLRLTRTAVMLNLDDETFDVEELSRKLKLSRSNLFRKLRALTDQSPSQYIRTIRLQKAVEMLRNDNTRINEIAYSVGFSNVSYFNKCFKEQFGYTPSEMPTH